MEIAVYVPKRMAGLSGQMVRQSPASGKESCEEVERVTQRQPDGPRLRVAYCVYSSLGRLPAARGSLRVRPRVACVVDTLRRPENCSGAPSDHRSDVENSGLMREICSGVESVGSRRTDQRTAHAQSAHSVRRDEREEREGEVQSRGRCGGYSRLQQCVGEDDGGGDTAFEKREAEREDQPVPQPAPCRQRVERRRHPVAIAKRMNRPLERLS
eukprot:scaffold73117_cov31-Tisochrysis_lutea.AAC.4